MKNSKTQIFLIFVFLLSKSVIAAEVKISVYPDSFLLPSIDVCTSTKVISCSSKLSDAIKLIQNTQWQNALKGNYSLVRLQLAKGVYRTDVPLTIDNWGNNSATNNVKLEIFGDGFNTVISGALPVTDWKLATNTDLPARVNPLVRGRLWVSDVSKLKIPVDNQLYSYGFHVATAPVNSQFFIGNEMQSIASWPNDGYAKLIRPAGLADSDKISFTIEGRDVNDWVGEPNMQAFAYWFHDWASHTFLIKVDALNNKLSTLGQGYGIKNGNRVKIKNALSELDLPGEWYLDRLSFKLYHLPVNDFFKDKSELSIASNLIRINTSKNILIHDMTLEKVRGDAVTVSNSNDILFENMQIQFTGARAVAINNSNNSGVSNSMIQDNGLGGILLDGGDRQMLVPSNNFVANSIIQRYSNSGSTYKPAVQMTGVGQCVFGSKIFDAPHVAIQFSGNNHIIANNEIFNVVLDSNDAGAIYVGRDLSARGTLITNNYFHDIVPHGEFNVKVVYVDDLSSGIIVRENIFANVQQPVFLSGGRDNLIEKNFFYNLKIYGAVHLDARGAEGFRSAVLDPTGPYQKSLDAVPYKSNIYAQFYPNLPKLREDDIGTPKYNILRNNLIVNGQLINISDSAKLGITLDNNFVGDNSIFVNSSINPIDFQFKSASEPFKQGLSIPKVIDFTKTYKCNGVYK